MSLTKQQVTALYIAVYNRAPDAAGLEYWTTEFDGTYADAAAGFVAHPLFATEYDGLTDQEVVEKFYTNILGSDGDTDGIDYWVARLEAGEDVNVILSEFLDVSLNGDFTGDVDAIARQDTLKNKVKVGLYYAEQLGDASNMGDKYDPNSADVVDDPAFQNAQEAIANVDNTNASVVAAQKAVDALVRDIPGETFYLDVGRDVLTGTDNADKFVADIVQNDNGQQVNTLGSGDRLDGGEGNDTLLAEVTQGAFVGGGNQQIQPKTVSIENIKLQSIASSIGGGVTQGNADQVYVNAKDMLGVNYIGSERSNADLIITDLTSKDNNGDMRDTADMTVGMKYTGNGNSNWNASNLSVYFDQDYLTRDSGFSRPSVDINVMNEDAYDETDAASPLAGVFLRELTVTVNGERFDLTQYIGEDKDGNGEEIMTYAELLTAVQNAIVDLQNANPDNAALQTLEATLNGKFYSDIDPNTGIRRVGDSIKLSVAGESDGKENTLTVESTDLELARVSGTKYENNNRYERADNQPAVQTDKLVAINVELEKAGLAGDGGELVIGSMNKGEGDTNTWNPDDVNTVGEGTVSGIEQFNVTVSGNKSQSSSLAGLRSTNNNLREVYVGSDQGSTANLTIGNSNTEGLLGDEYVELDFAAAALKDVRIFDASAFNGDLNLLAALTGDVTEKYLEDGDGEFVYTGGTGNDTIDLLISADNLAASGTATHGDFTLEINGGAGNDTITVGIYDESGLANAGDAAAWYANQKTNANLSIDAGNGDDTVNLEGSGDWVVDLGAGDDVIYVDNAGGSADEDGFATSSWIFNATGAEYNEANGWENAVGGGNSTYNLYKAGVTLTFTDATGGDFELSFVVSPDAGNGFKTTQKAINEAIKNAIENDTVFSALLEAKTGQMAHTLIIDSLIDGATNLGIKIEQLMDEAGRDAFNKKYGTNISSGDLSQAKTANANLSDVLAQEALDNENEVQGSDGDTFGAQIITGGKGDDVLVLGTSENQMHTLVYEGYENGTDTIVNFTANTLNSGEQDGDIIDLSDYKATAILNGTYANTDAIKTAVNSEAAGVYIVFDEYASNDGAYKVSVWEKTATDAVELGKVGVMDFGGSLDFANAEQFTLA